MMRTDRSHSTDYSVCLADLPVLYADRQVLNKDLMILSAGHSVSHADLHVLWCGPFGPP